MVVSTMTLQGEKRLQCQHISLRGAACIWLQHAAGRCCKQSGGFQFLARPASHDSKNIQEALRMTVPWHLAHFRRFRLAVQCLLQDLREGSSPRSFGARELRATSTGHPLATAVHVLQ